MANGFSSGSRKQLLIFVSIRHSSQTYTIQFTALAIQITKMTFVSLQKNLDRWLSSLSAKKFFALGFGDESISTSLDEQFNDWSKKMLLNIVGEGDEIDEGIFLKSPPDNTPASDNDDSDKDDTVDDGVVDIEDVIKSNGSCGSKITKDPAEMITPRLRAELTKQGYRLIGSHSGVKMCRWTKAMMRGRGGCYKHTFYGIASHQCMEATPSLACANKCVFCWEASHEPSGHRVAMEDG